MDVGVGHGNDQIEGRDQGGNMVQVALEIGLGEVVNGHAGRPLSALTIVVIASQAASSFEDCRARLVLRVVGTHVARRAEWLWCFLG